MVKVRLIGNREEVERAIRAMERVGKVVLNSKEYPSRYHRDSVRRYLEVEFGGSK